MLRLPRTAPNERTAATPAYEGDPLVDYVPSDYEACGECGYDHEYEYTEAHRWHSDPAHGELEHDRT